MQDGRIVTRHGERKLETIHGTVHRYMDEVICNGCRSGADDQEHEDTDP